MRRPATVALLTAVALAVAAGLAAVLVRPASSGPDAAHGPPRRVVSMNLCTDQLALLVAAPEQLVSLSHVAQDPLSSALWRKARRFPANHAGAEEIFLARPDLVLAGTYDSPATIGMLRRLGLRVAQFPIETNFSDIRVNLLRMGTLLGRERSAHALVNAFDARLAAMPSAHGPRPEAALYYAGSYTSGTGTLADSVLTAAWFDNVATRLGRTGLSRLSLEELVLAAPDAIVASPAYVTPARAQEVLGHPALDQLRGTRRLHVDQTLWTCGTPMVADAVAALAASR